MAFSIATTCAALLLCMMAVITLVSCQPSIPPNGQAYFGADPGGGNGVADMATFETLVGRKMAAHRTFLANGWNSVVLPEARMLDDQKSGRIPMVSWKPGTSWAAVAKGAVDPWLNATAHSLKSWGYPLWLTFHHEPEDNVDNTTGHSAADFVAMWRHIHAIFAKAGAKNVAWNWIMMSYSWSQGAGPARRQLALELYPGDDVVDWISVDSYNWIAKCPIASWSRWTDLANVVAPFYAWASPKGKPMAIPEYGCLENAANHTWKGEWFRHIPTQFAAKYPLFKAFVYFNVGTTTQCDNWNIQTSAESLAGYKYHAHHSYMQYFHSHSTTTAPATSKPPTTAPPTPKPSTQPPTTAPPTTKSTTVPPTTKATTVPSTTKATTAPPTTTPSQCDYVLKYNMDTDKWTGPRGLPSLLHVYNSAKSNWGYTAAEHVTASVYPDTGVKYVQLKMQHYSTNPGLASWFGPGSYCCRISYADGGSTSFTTGRVQWTEEWTGAAKVKTSMMHWFDSVTVNGVPPTWPDAGERDLLEQWESTAGGQGTLHKGPVTVGADGKQHHPMQIRQYAGVNTSKRTTFRATFTDTLATVEVLRNGSWVVVGEWTDPTYWQPGRPYHVGAALAYSQQVPRGALYDDPARGNAVRKISQLKVWAGKHPCYTGAVVQAAETGITSGSSHHHIQAWYVVVPVVVVAVLVAVALVVLVIVRRRQQQCSVNASYNAM